jgi:hypothetical protein
LKLSAPSCRAEAINGKINRLDTRPQATKIRNPNVRTATKLRNKVRSETTKTENTNEIQTQIFSLRTSQDFYNHGGRRPPSLNLIGIKTKTWLTSTLELANETGKWQIASTLNGPIYRPKQKLKRLLCPWGLIEEKRQSKGSRV